MTEFLGDSPDEICYGKVPLKSVLFQDDIARLTTSPRAARSGNIKLHQMAQLKQLEMHPDKTVFMVLGRKENVDRIRKEITANPISFGNLDTKEVKQERWLGDIFHNEGLSKSVEATVSERTGRTKAAIMECRAIIQDHRMASAGGILSAFHIWDHAIVQSLLNNSEVWVDISEKTITSLESLQNMHLRLTFDTPSTTPRCAALWDSAMEGMRFRVMKRKLRFINFLKNADESFLSKQIYQEQLNNNWPGLVAEAKKLCAQLNLPDITTCLLYTSPRPRDS